MQYFFKVSWIRKYPGARHCQLSQGSLLAPHIDWTMNIWWNYTLELSFAAVGCCFKIPPYPQTESDVSGASTKTKTQHLNLMWKRRELGFAAKIVGVKKFAADLRLIAFALLPRLTTAAWKWLRPHIGGRLSAPVPCSVIWATFALHPDDRADERENNDNDNNESVLQQLMTLTWNWLRPQVWQEIAQGRHKFCQPHYYEKMPTLYLATPWVLYLMICYYRPEYTD